MGADLLTLELKALLHEVRFLPEQSSSIPSHSHTLLPFAFLSFPHPLHFALFFFQAVLFPSLEDMSRPLYPAIPDPNVTKKLTSLHGGKCVQGNRGIKGLEG